MRIAIAALLLLSGCAEPRVGIVPVAPSRLTAFRPCIVVVADDPLRNTLICSR